MMIIQLCMRAESLLVARLVLVHSKLMHVDKIDKKSKAVLSQRDRAMRPI